MAAHSTPDRDYLIESLGGIIDIDIGSRGKAMFITHNGLSRLPRRVELPSLTRVSHRPTLQIQELVAVSYWLHPGIMTSKWRGHKKACWARQIAMYLTREITHRTMPAIGKAFGGRHHTTVMHAIRTVQRRMVEDPLVAGDVDVLRKALTR